MSSNKPVQQPLNRSEYFFGGDLDYFKNYSASYMIISIHAADDLYKSISSQSGWP
jgi:hypothetical protein